MNHPQTSFDLSRGGPTAEVVRPSTRLLSRGNAKLGLELIWSFSIPAVATCPGSTPACRAACYARRGRYAFASVKARYAMNLRRTAEPGFVDDLVGEIRTNRIRVVRVHGSGDFYSPDYVDRWVEVARRSPRVLFYAYTRSWREPAIREALRGFAGLSNARLWYSADRDTGPPPRDPGVRVAWMLGPDEAPDSVPSGADLVFRARRRAPLKRAKGVLVCPHEQAVARKGGPITCDRCGVCFAPPGPEGPPSATVAAEVRRTSRPPHRP